MKPYSKKVLRKLVRDLWIVSLIMALVVPPSYPILNCVVQSEDGSCRQCFNSASTFGLCSKSETFGSGCFLSSIYYRMWVPRPNQFCSDYCLPTHRAFKISRGYFSCRAVPSARAIQNCFFFVLIIAVSSVQMEPLALMGQAASP